MRRGDAQCVAPEQAVCAVLVCNEQCAVLQHVVLQHAVLQSVVCSAWCVMCSVQCAFLGLEGSLRGGWGWQGTLHLALLTPPCSME